MPEPIVVDEVLGTLTWQDRFRSYKGEREIAPGHLIRIDISPDNGRLEADLTRARQAYQHLQQQETVLREMAADALLPRYNAVWNEGQPIDRAAFMRRMVLEGLTVYGDQTVALDYNDGDLFYGHTIVVSLREDGTFENATIQG